MHSDVVRPQSPQFCASADVLRCRPLSISPLPVGLRGTADWDGATLRRNPLYRQVTEDYLKDPHHCPYDAAARNMLRGAAEVNSYTRTAP